MTVVTFVDETTGGGDTGRWGLEFLEERVARRELIRRRIDQEAAEFNAAGRAEFRGLVLTADRQIESLDEEIDLAQDDELTFLKLVPLVGG